MPQTICHAHKRITETSEKRRFTVNSRDNERESYRIGYLFASKGGLDVAARQGGFTPYPSPGCPIFAFQLGDGATWPTLLAVSDYTSHFVVAFALAQAA
jgi:hypothetical protein